MPPRRTEDTEKEKGTARSIIDHVIGDTLDPTDYPGSDKDGEYRYDFSSRACFYNRQ